jgi:hypothetical protein
MGRGVRDACASARLTSFPAVSVVPLFFEGVMAGKRTA